MDGRAKTTIAQKLHMDTLPFFQPSKTRVGATVFSMKKAIANISRNRHMIPDRYWSGDTLKIALDEVQLEYQSNLETRFTMEGRTGDRCRMVVKSDNYTDTHECGGVEFGDYIHQIRLNSTEAKKLKELYILTKEDVTLADLLHCDNMEIRRDAIKKMGYDTIKEHAIMIDTYEDYDLLDLQFAGEDFGRFLKMVDSTSKETYLLQVPRTRDFGSIKIPMDKAQQALAWSFNKQIHEYHPDDET